MHWIDNNYSSHTTNKELMLCFVIASDTAASMEAVSYNTTFFIIWFHGMELLILVEVSLVSLWLLLLSSYNQYSNTCTITDSSKSWYCPSVS